MKLLYLTNDDAPGRAELADAFKPCGIDCIHIRAASHIIGIFPIVAAIKRHKPDAIMANTPDILINCTLGRKLASCPALPVIALIDANARRPKGIVSDLRTDVAKWIFPSERHANAYPPDLRARAVAPIASLLTEDPPEIASAPDATSYIWLGPIDGNTETLRAAIDLVNDGPNASLTVCGQGKAKYTMPAVRQSRYIQHPERIVWTGEEPTPQSVRELLRTQRSPKIVRSSFDPTPLELAAEWLISPQTNPSPRQRVEYLANEILSILHYVK